MKKRLCAPGELARLRAGYTLEQAAKAIKDHRNTRLESTMRRLRQYELHGGMPDLLATRLAALYSCDWQVLAYPVEDARKWLASTLTDNTKLAAAAKARATTKGAVLQRKGALFNGMLSKPACGADTVSSHKRTHRAARRLLQIT